MTEKTKLIRGILDAATSDNLAEAERLIDEYVENEVINFEEFIGAGERLRQALRADFKEYVKKQK